MLHGLLRSMPSAASGAVGVVVLTSEVEHVLPLSDQVQNHYFCRL
jgi:hypothetical protein